MDGDMAPLEEMTTICEKHSALLIVDEAHATGVIGERGEGLVQMLNLQHRCFARVHTFGKALGCHGAVVLGSNALIQYLVNFSRAFIYTTALPPVAADAIKSAYHIFPGMVSERNHLKDLIALFQSIPVNVERPPGTTPIQVLIIPGNEQVKKTAVELQQQNLDVRAILYPTVPKERERLRIVLHSFNTHAEIRLLLEKVHLEK
jgi:8-amino-7-oxononanoate synthase